MIFPSITVCNLNQVEASFIKEPIDFENVSLSRMTKTDLLMKEFMFGHQDNLTQEEEKYLETVKNWRNFKAFTFLEWTRQYCNHAFISSSFRWVSSTPLKCSLLSTSSILQSVHHLQMTSSEGFQHLVAFALISFAVQK